eukprot:m.240410 g.240410  ORF g.240410 m.240410 type:complete len:131 (+) comp26279_c0_seq3:1957-2349(+)
MVEPVLVRSPHLLAARLSQSPVTVVVAPVVDHMEEVEPCVEKEDGGILCEDIREEFISVELAVVSGVEVGNGEVECRVEDPVGPAAVVGGGRRAADEHGSRGTLNVSVWRNPPYLCAQVVRPGGAGAVHV